MYTIKNQRWKNHIRNCRNEEESDDETHINLLGIEKNSMVDYAPQSSVDDTINIGKVLQVVRGAGGAIKRLYIARLGKGNALDTPKWYDVDEGLKLINRGNYTL